MNDAAEKPRKSLADEIRDSEQPFIDAATEAFRQRLSAEYRRLRGYAIEAGTESIGLRVHVQCEFSEHPRVVLTSVPDFVPAAGVVAVEVRTSR